MRKSTPKEVAATLTLTYTLFYSAYAKLSHLYLASYKLTSGNSGDLDEISPMCYLLRMRTVCYVRFIVHFYECIYQYSLM